MKYKSKSKPAVVAMAVWLLDEKNTYQWEDPTGVAEVEEPI